MSRHPLDRSAAHEVLLHAYPAFRRQDMDTSSATITRFLEAFYASDSLDMHEFARIWVGTPCDECGAIIPDDEPSMVSASHTESCSLHPGAVVVAVPPAVMERMRRVVDTALDESDPQGASWPEIEALRDWLDRQRVAEWTAADAKRLEYLETLCEDTGGRMGVERADELDALRRRAPVEPDTTYPFKVTVADELGNLFTAEVTAQGPNGAITGLADQIRTGRVVVS